MLNKKSVHYINIFMFCLQLKEEGKKFLDCGRGSVKILGVGGGGVNIFRTGEVQVLRALSLLGVSTSLHGMKIQLSEDLRLNKKIWHHTGIQKKGHLFWKGANQLEIPDSRNTEASS